MAIKKEVFHIRPLEHIYALQYPEIYPPPTFGDWPSMNVDVDHHRIQKRSGYVLDRNAGDGVKIYNINSFEQETATRHTLILTDTDLLKRETGTGKTFSYKTETYTTGTITTITGGTSVVGDGTVWDSTMVGDKFILNTASDHVADEEPSSGSNWATIESVEGPLALTLSSAYTGSATSGDYKIRRIYSVPSGERWSIALMKGVFYFTNGNVNVQKWTGSNYAADANASKAIKSRYIIEYGNRLCHADYEISSARSQWSFMWSKEGDGTNYTDSTYGEADFTATEDKLRGLGKVGNNLFIYKENSFIIAVRTGIPDDPFDFPYQRIGVGLSAPYSLVHFMGTNAFLGRDDFYIIEGDQAESIGENIRRKFFEIVSYENSQKVWGLAIPNSNKVMWIANTSEGQFAFVWDYKEKEWTTYEFYDDIHGGGVLL